MGGKLSRGIFGEEAWLREKRSVSMDSALGRSQKREKLNQPTKLFLYFIIHVPTQLTLLTAPSGVTRN